MGYKRRQIDLERMAKKNKIFFRQRNPVAKELHSPKYSQRVVKDKTKYSRTNNSKEYYSEEE
jgi:hypothetical protein|tara:strand:+ start:1218 stop:1403 length:186 start_codon:yes stop_codon:yes gene_type:complete